MGVQGFRSAVVRVRDRRDRRWAPRLRHCHLAILCLGASLFACGPDSSPSSTGHDTAPAAVTDLRGAPLDPGGVELRWTAVGDDGLTGRAEGIEIRMHADALVTETWGAASLVWAARPAPPGDPESVVLRGLPRGVQHFGLRTSDSSGNLSALSNVAVVEVGGAAAPAAVMNLAVAEVGDHTLRLTWTAPPGVDDSAATVYDMRYDSGALTPASWEKATRVAGLSRPGLAGAPESVTIADLVPGSRYFVALRSAVQIPNWSPLSNVAVATTQQYVRLTSAAGRVAVFGYSLVTGRPGTRLRADRSLLRSVHKALQSKGRRYGNETGHRHGLRCARPRVVARRRGDRVRTLLVRSRWEPSRRAQVSVGASIVGSRQSGGSRPRCRRLDQLHFLVTGWIRARLRRHLVGVSADP